MVDDRDGPATVEARPPGSGKRARVPADTDPVPLATLGEPDAPRYINGVEMARGGMGRVVEATDTRLGRTVALKEALGTDPETLRRFVRETRITARLEHPSIVPVYDAGTSEDGTPFYVMRKVTGRPLDELVRAAPDLRGRLALLAHVVAASQAVAHAHERGVIHRDVKPSNILVGNLGETVVIDWGLAKVTDEPDEPGLVQPATVQLAGDSLRTHIGAVLGTPGFMSPEQLRSPDVDARSDVYALGATLYFVLACKAPHAAPTGDAMMEAAAAGPPVPLSRFLRGVPAELETIVDKALAFDDRERYPHAGALAEELQRFLTGRLVASHHYSPLHHATRFFRRHRVAVIAVALAGVALAVGGVVAVGRVVTARDEAMARAREADDARHSETERADELVLSQARLILDRDPAAAIAMVRPLAGGAHWRDVHAIAAGAAAAGVAWRLPGTTAAVGVAMAPDGVHAASIGADGALRVYDLVAHTGRDLSRIRGDLTVLDYIDDRRLVAWNPGASQIVLIDVATGSGREIAVASPVSLLHAQRAGVYWVDFAHHGWRLDPASAPTRLPVDDDLEEVVPSLVGDRLIACGAHGLWIVSAGPAVRIYDRPTTFAAWSDDGTAVVATTQDDLVAITLGATPAVHHLAIGARSSLAIAGDEVYSQGIAGLAVGDQLQPHAQRTDDDMLGVHRAGSDLVVTSIDDGKLVALDAHDRIELASPVHDISSLATSRGSRRVVIAAGGSVFAWDLDPLLPRLYPLEKIATVGAVDDHSVYITGTGHAMWLDLATGEQRAAPTVAPLAMRVIASQTGPATVLSALDDTPTLVHVGAMDTTPMTGALVYGAFAGSDRFVGVDSQGNVTAYDLAAKRSRAIAQLGGRALAFSVAGTWLAAVGATGQLVRVDVAATTPPRELAPTNAPLSVVVTSEGRALVATGAQLAWWQADGTLAPHVTLPHKLTSLFAYDDDHVFARDTATTGYLVDLRTPTVTTLDPMPLPVLSPARGAGLAVIPMGNGAHVFDMAARVSWTMARAWQAPLTIMVTRDGTFLYATSGTSLVTWAVPVPRSAAETARWVDTLTNARWDAATDAVQW